MESPLVTTDVIMVPVFPYLAVRYAVGDVPTTVANTRTAAVGPLDEAAYLEAIMKHA